MNRMIFQSVGGMVFGGLLSWVLVGGDGARIAYSTAIFAFGYSLGVHVTCRFFRGG